MNMANTDNRQDLFPRLCYHFYVTTNLTEMLPYKVFHLNKDLACVNTTI